MRRFLTVLAIATLPLVPIAAQYELSVDAVIGFGGVFRAGSWTPVHVTVQNLGRDVRGTLTLEVERGDRFGPDRTVTTYAREIELVSGTSKAYGFVLPLDTTVYPLSVRITDGDETAYAEEYDLLGRSVPERLVLVLARRPNLDFLLPLYNTRDERALDIVYPLPGYLPEAWQGYEAVDLVVLHDARMQELSLAQVVAIRDWIAAGGRLVISGGAHFGPADAETLAPIGDFRPLGIGTIAVEEAGLPELGLPLAPDERTAEVVATGFVDGGTRARRIRIGRGDVIVLPADYANLVRVAPRTSIALWNGVLGRRASMDAVATELRRRVFETDILANQLNLPLYDFPSRLLILGLGVSFLLGVGGILLWMAYGTSRLRGWLGAPGLVAVIAVVSVAGHAALTRQLQPIEALALTIERAELVSEAGYALVTRDTALFSRQLAEYEVSYDGTPLLVPMQERDHRVVRGATTATQRVTVERWGYANTVAVQVVPLEVGFEVVEGDGYLSLTLRNESGGSLTGVTLLRNGFPESLGDISTGGVIEHVVPTRAATAPPSGNGDDPLASSGRFQAIEWAKYVPDDALAPNRARLLGDVARAQRFDAETAPELIVVAWTTAPLLPARISPAFEREIDLHLLSIRIDLPGGAP